MEVLVIVNEFTERFLAKIPMILEMHFQRIEQKYPAYYSFVSRHHNVVSEALIDGIKRHVEAMVVSYDEYEALLKYNFEKAFVEGERTIELEGHNIVTVLDLSKDIYACIHHYFYPVLEQSVLTLSEKLFLQDRIYEVSWTNFLGFIQGYLNKKEQVIFSLHNQKMSIMGQMAAGMAHEIRNPLTVVKGFLQIMERKLTDGSLPPQEASDYIRNCIQEIATMERLVSDFLLLSRKQPASQSRSEIISVIRVIRRVKELAAHFSLEKNVTISLDDSGMELFVVGIEKHLEQIFLNIIKNAVDASSAGDHVFIQLERNPESKQVVIRFIDQGYGMPEEVADRAFDPFFTTKEGGTGLGLSICKQLVEGQGGRIFIQSKVSGGTTVEIHLEEP